MFCVGPTWRILLVYNSLSLSLALQPFGWWPLFSFLILYTVGRTSWTGDQTSQCHYLHTEQTHTVIHASSTIRTPDPSVRAGEDESCLRSHGHCDRLTGNKNCKTEYQVFQNVSICQNLSFYGSLDFFDYSSLYLSDLYEKVKPDTWPVICNWRKNQWNLIGLAYYVQFSFFTLSCFPSFLS
jgi:hypothetical protein